MNCRPGCGACCIVLSISEALPGLPSGKPANVRCIHLDEKNLCTIHHLDSYPTICGTFEASIDRCGDDAEEAMELLLERGLATRASSMEDLILHASPALDLEGLKCPISDEDLTVVDMFTEKKEQVLFTPDEIKALNIKDLNAQRLAAYTAYTHSKKIPFLSPSLHKLYVDINEPVTEGEIVTYTVYKRDDNVYDEYDKYVTKVRQKLHVL